MAAGRLNGRRAGALIGLLLASGVALLGLAVFVRAFLPDAGMAAMGAILGPILFIPGIVFAILALLAWRGDAVGRVGTIGFAGLLGLLMGSTLYGTLGIGAAAGSIGGCEGPIDKGAGSVVTCQEVVAGLPAAGASFLDVAWPLAVLLLCVVAVALLLFRWDGAGDA